MIKNIKNISNSQLDWGLGITHEINELLNIDCHKSEHFDKLCEFGSIGSIEVYSVDGSLLTLSEYIEWYQQKIDRISKEGNYPLIYDFVDKSYNRLFFQSLDYKKGLLSGVKLHPVYTLDINGLLIETIYYVDETKTKQVLKVNNSYILDDNLTLEPSAREVLSRTTTRTWIDTNGDEIVKSKLSPKIYDTFDKKNTEGQRRRNNLINSVTVNLVTALILTGTTANKTTAQELLVSFFQSHSASFNNYKVTGRGEIYNDITNDNSTWLDVVVQDDVNTQTLIPQMIGLNLKNYSISKLKGNIE